MERSLSFERNLRTAVRVCKVAAYGLIPLAISAVLISMRILACDRTDMIWDHPSMFFDIVRMAYEPDSGSGWGLLWDLFFLCCPMMVYVTFFVTDIWEQREDDRHYRTFANYVTPTLATPQAPEREAPELFWDYEEMTVSFPPVRSRRQTLPGGFHVVMPGENGEASMRPPAPAKPHS